MKILFISSPPFADCDFPLIKTLQEAGNDVTYLIHLTPYSLKSTLFNIKNKLKKCNYSGKLLSRVEGL